MTPIKIEKGGYPDFVKTHSHTIASNGKVYSFFPYWIEMNGDGMVAHKLGSLPEDLEKQLLEIRHPEYLSNQNITITEQHP